MSALSSGAFVCVSSVRSLSLDPRVRGRRVAWRRSSPVCSFLRVCLRPRWVFRAGVGGAGAAWVSRGSLVVLGLRVGASLRRVVSPFSAFCQTDATTIAQSAAAGPCLRAAEARSAAAGTLGELRCVSRLKRSRPSAQIAQRKTSIHSPKHPAEHPPCATRPKHLPPPNHRAISHTLLGPDRPAQAPCSTIYSLAAGGPTTSPVRTAGPRADRTGDQRGIPDGTRDPSTAAAGTLPAGSRSSIPIPEAKRRRSLRRENRANYANQLQRLHPSFVLQYVAHDAPHHIATTQPQPPPRSPDTGWHRQAAVCRAQPAAIRAYGGRAWPGRSRPGPLSASGPRGYPERVPPAVLADGSPS